MLLSAFDLLGSQLKFNRDTIDSATDVVRRSAGRGRIPAGPVGMVRGEDMLDNLFAAAPEAHVTGLKAAMSAYENGSDGVLRQGLDWTALDVPAVMQSPFEIALGQSWPWNDDAFGLQLRKHWDSVLGDALARPGVTVAVVPLRVLAERGGLQLKARGA